MKTDVNIFEVGPRDGLQNEPKPISLATKIWFVQSLMKAGVRDLELGAFVRSDRVPQMADTDELFQAARAGRLRLGSVRAWSLVPNLVGFERALRQNVKHISIFTAASNRFNLKNIGMTIRESLVQYQEVTREAQRNGIQVRGYVSTSFGCPYEGKVAAKSTLKVIEALLNLGCFQVSIGDTIGVAVPKTVDAVLKPAIKNFGKKKLAVHFHDTRGTALANTLRSYEFGIRAIDSSAGGLGGCPYAPGARGNLATEDLVYMLEGMGVRTGINLVKLCETSLEMAKKMKRPLTSRYLQAYEASLKMRVK